MSRDLQLHPQDVRGWSKRFDFNSLYSPNSSRVTAPYPGAGIQNPGETAETAPDPGETALDFRVGDVGAYSEYNWETFYHAPTLIASLLLQNQKFADALTWLEYIFNPMDASGGTVPQRYWQFAPFNAMQGPDWTSEQIQNLLATLAADTQQGISDPETTAIQNWMNDPYDPHAVASVRVAAYGKATVMQFLDTLIAWGDWYYSQYTAEMVSYAEQLYVLADMLLGPRPRTLRLADASASAPPPTYASLKDVDLFSNALVSVENVVVAAEPPQALAAGTSQLTALPQLPGSGKANSLLFCIPPNRKLLGYWDTVAQRLYNIRHCLNLQGQAVPLPLYAPPISPLSLVEQQSARAGAGGGTSAAPIYRFSVYLQKAVELTNDVRAYGALILSALEKQDAEALAVLRANQEVDIQTRMLDVKAEQVTEAQDQVTALQNQQAVVQVRYNFYSTVAFTNDWENAAIAAAARGPYPGRRRSRARRHVGHRSRGPHDGGRRLRLRRHAHRHRDVRRGEHRQLGQLMVIRRPRARRNTRGCRPDAGDDGRLPAPHGRVEPASLAGPGRTDPGGQPDHGGAGPAQHRQAGTVDRRGTRSRNASAGQRLPDHQVHQRPALQLDEHPAHHRLHPGLPAGVRVRAAGADRVLVRARPVRAETQDNFIQFGYWDSQHRGLTAGESLLFDLRRMEAGYVANNARELELTKHVSLVMTAPTALVELRETGTCTIKLDEALFEYDHPGHYLRRLRSVAVTVPCVTGPYTGVNATLTLNSAMVRTQAAGQNYKPQPADGELLAGVTASPGGAAGTETIVTSTGQQDAGLFEVNLHDERWLPFEGQGAISTWTLTLDPRDNNFDFTTITDVILHVRYTARDGGDQAAGNVRNALKPSDPRTILVSVRNTFPDSWYAFFNPAAQATEQTLNLPLTASVFPYTNLGNGTAEIANLAMYLVLSVPAAGSAIAAGLTGAAGEISLAPMGGTTTAGDPPDALTAAVAFEPTLTTPQALSLTVPLANVPAALGTTVNGQTVLDPAKVADLLLVVTYSIG